MTDHTKIPRIGILVGTSHAWGRNIIKGILSYAYAKGPWNTWIAPNHSDDLDAFLSESTGSGIIAQVSSPEIAAKLTRSGLPLINIADNVVKGFSAPCIRTDDQTATRMAAEYFVKKGFKHTALVAPLDRPNPAWYARAFERTLSEYNLPCSLFPYVPDKPVPNQAMIEWLTSLPKPVAILTWGTSFGRQVVNCCLQADITVPHDVSVLSGGYDELLSHASYPPLSGIRIPTEQIGYKAAELLDKMMQGERVPAETTYLPPIDIMEHLSSDTLAVEDSDLAKAIRYLQKHACESIGMSDLLKQVPLSRRTLERRFQQTFGRTPNEEIRRVRINKARQLLIETDLPLPAIAESCGYAAYNYLTRIFKEDTGMSPRTYRNSFGIY